MQFNTRKMEVRLQQLMPIQLALLILLTCSLSSHTYSQKNAREKAIMPYIPYDHDSYEDFPLVTIKCKAHIMQMSADDPKNFQDTPEDRKRIQEIIDNCNHFYKKLTDPSIKLDPLPPTIHDSRIRYRLDEIVFHVDSIGWDRHQLTVSAAGKWPLPVDSINRENRELIFYTTIAHSGFRQSDSMVVSTDNGPITLQKESVRKVGKWTVLKVKDDITELQPINATYYKSNDLNCSADNWKNFTNEDKNYLHIFFTGSSKKPLQFGCAPSPYFMNVSNFIFGGGWAGWQLTAHEIGHTLGLGHTFTPQFSDLPNRDKRCSGCPCNDTDLSNNIMGYNGCRNYLSPMQIGSVYKNYTSDPKRIRITTACDYDPEKSITIRGKETWERSRAMQGDLIVKKGATLHIKSHQYLSSGATLYIERKAKVIVENCKVTNGCDHEWNGIVYCKKFSRKKLKKAKRRKGKLFLKGAGAIERVRGQ